MDILNQIITSLTKEEIRYFKLYLNRISLSGDRKDENLFDYMRKSGEAYKEEFIFKKLYTGTDKNSFYRLKNRLLEDLGSNLTNMHTDKSDTNYLLLQLSLYQIFIMRDNLKVAMFYLKRAERKALATENFELLDIIYSSYIKLSNNTAEISPEEYIRKQIENAEKLNRIRAIDQTLAAVSYRLKTTQTFERKPTAVLQMLEATIKEFGGDASLRKSKSFQTRLYRLVSQQFLQTHNYKQLERYMVITIQAFEDEGWFDKTNHDTKLQMMVYLANALFKNEKYQESLEVAKKLGEEIQAYQQLHYAKYVFYYYNTLYINYAATNIANAIKALDDLDKVMKQLKNSYYEQFILLNKATLLFEQKKFNDAIKQLVRLYVNDSYKNTSDSFKLKVVVAEMIMEHEIGDTNSFNKRLGQVRKDFGTQLNQRQNGRDKQFLKILELMGNNPAWKTTPKYTKIIQKFADNKAGVEGEESELLNYRNWLNNKINALGSK
jgi:predicted negative regulator of RcsB-dependent stress response